MYIALYLSMREREKERERRGIFNKLAHMIVRMVTEICMGSQQAEDARES